MCSRRADLCVFRAAAADFLMHAAQNPLNNPQQFRSVSYQKIKPLVLLLFPAGTYEHWTLRQQVRNLCFVYIR